VVVGPADVRRVPTRRSSDLVVGGVAEVLDPVGGELRLLVVGVAHPEVEVADERGVMAVGRRSRAAAATAAAAPSWGSAAAPGRRDRKRTRLNSSHHVISSAV